jgi:hypothetical protein
MELSANSPSQEINRSTSLNSFTIPKKQRNILQDNTNNASDTTNQDGFLLYQDEKEQLLELQALITEPTNFLNNKSDNGYTLTKMLFVKNAKLENEFVYVFISLFFF